MLLLEFYFSPIKYAIRIPIRAIPISIPISSLKLLPFPWNSHGNGDCRSGDALVMCHRLCGSSTYGLKAHVMGDDLSSPKLCTALLYL